MTPGIAALLAEPAPVIAPALLGATIAGRGVTLRITEVEAYSGTTDPGSHGHRGMTERNRHLFGPPGTLYAYRSYGIHWCLNFVCREAGHGAGVLIRALQPTHGVDVMRTRRGMDDERLLCAGPGRVGQALGIGAAHYGLPLDAAPFTVLAAPADAAPVQVLTGPRIGISRAVDVPWRFGLAGSRHLSRGFRPPRT